MTELNQEGFERLLAVLDANRDKAPDKYLQLRRVLNFFFERDGVRNADELTDETIARVTQKLASGIEKTEGEIRNIAAYCQKFANFVLQEDRRKRQKKMIEVTDDLPDKTPGPDDELQRQRRFACMRQCLQSLKDRDRELVIQYEKVNDRNELAKKQGLTTNALRLRIFQIKKKLKPCLAQCMKKSV